jgi:hypothetical protein
MHRGTEKPMVVTLKVGDRVRVTVYGRVEGYAPGDKGTVLRTPPPVVRGMSNYLVAMDKDKPDDTGVLFAAHEIEPDV